MKEEHYQNHIQGMLCRQCEESVCLSLNSQRGVLSSKCSFLRGTVDVTYDSDIIDSSEIEKILEASGYPVGKKKAIEYILEFLFFLILIGIFYGLKSLKNITLPSLDSNSSLYIVFLAGLLTGTHCVSMCGGISLGVTQVNKNRRWKSVLQYHIGRVVMCVLLGSIFGGVGGVFSYNTKAKSMILTFLGILMIVIALRMWGIFPLLRDLDVLLPSFCKFPKGVSKSLFGKAFLIGVFTGIMPCGASYAMWICAASSGSALKGSTLMGVWCLGTVPLLLVMSLWGCVIPTKYRKWMNLANIMLITFWGISMIVNGLSLIA